MFCFRVVLLTIPQDGSIKAVAVILIPAFVKPCVVLKSPRIASRPQQLGLVSIAELNPPGPTRVYSVRSAYDRCDPSDLATVECSEPAYRRLAIQPNTLAGSALLAFYSKNPTDSHGSESD